MVTIYTLDNIDVLGRILIRGTVDLQIKNNSKVDNHILVNRLASNSTISGKSDVKEVLVNAFSNAMLAFFRDMPQVFYIDSSKMGIGIESTIQGTNVTYKVTLGNKAGDTYYAKGFTSKAQVEEAINNYIKEKDIKDIIDIKFSVSASISGEEQIYCFSAMIIYYED